jgi:hypothetical protein
MPLHGATISSSIAQAKSFLFEDFEDFSGKVAESYVMKGEIDFVVR